MSEGSNSNTSASLFDAAKRLYPDSTEKQDSGATNSSKGSSDPASPFVVTNMTSGKTIYFDPNTGESFEMETRNAIDHKSKKDADAPYMGIITGVTHPTSEKDKKKFGWAMITTDDERHRWIHGGGSALPNYYAARQGWKPTYGCTRGQNEDVKEMGKRIKQFQDDHPNVPIMYYRVRPEE